MKLWWWVFETVTILEVPIRSFKCIGVIGGDINADHLAVTETDRFGNSVEVISMPCVPYGKTAELCEALIGEVVKAWYCL